MSLHNQERKSVGELLRELSQQVVGLVRGEIAMARAELRHNMNKVMGGAMSIAAGLALCLAALIILLEALVYGIANYLPGWLAAVIVGVVVGLIGLIMLMSGQSALKPKNLAPRRTAESLRDDAYLAQEHLRGESPAQREIRTEEQEHRHTEREHKDHRRRESRGTGGTEGAPRAAQ
jgi:uncharacterized membrane protein YqjE